MSGTGIKAAVKLIKALPEFTPQASIFCMEHTGIYNAMILSQHAIFSFPTCRAAWRLESSMQIKKAGGLQNMLSGFGTKHLLAATTPIITGFNKAEFSQAKTFKFTFTIAATDY